MSFPSSATLLSKEQTDRLTVGVPPFEPVVEFMAIAPPFQDDVAELLIKEQLSTITSEPSPTINPPP